jgi:hypothetical protein
MCDNYNLKYLRNITRSFILLFVLTHFENDLCVIVTPLEINVSDY